MQNLSVRREQSWLSWFFRGLLVLGILVMLGRLAELQVIKGAYYRELAEGNRIRRVAITAERGKVYDRNGEVLVENVAVAKTTRFDPVDGYSKILADETTPADEIITEWDRYYVYGADMGHITGYLAEANADEVARVNADCLDKGARKLGSLVGRGGLEQFYDCMLRGIDGEEMVEVDIVGRRVRSLGRLQPAPGENITTTLDYKIQRKLAELMKGNKGAAVVSTPTGEILAIYSSPSFDPNIFSTRGSSQVTEIQKILTDQNLPLFNRAIAGTYPPGSIFKIVTTAAAIEEGKIDKGYLYEDTGVIREGEFEFSNWYLTQYGGTEGTINVVRALARSTNTFYYAAGALVGPTALVDWSKKFGLGARTNIDLPGETTGLVPSPEWKMAVKGERWYLGNTYHMAIGQGDLSASVVGTHRIAMTIANNGTLCPLHLISGSVDCSEKLLGQQTLELISEGMVAACAPGGTGVPFFDFSPKAACKTGTAQPSTGGDNHAWFSVFAPAENPEVVITIFVEHGGEGSKVAAPIARGLADFIFNP